MKRILMIGTGGTIASQISGNALSPQLRPDELLALVPAISKLCEKERTIIELRYGINTIGGVEKTQKEVADLLGISQSYISRLEKRIIKKLRREIMKQY